MPDLIWTPGAFVYLANKIQVNDIRSSLVFEKTWVKWQVIDVEGQAKDMDMSLSSIGIDSS